MEPKHKHCHKKTLLAIPVYNEQEHLKDVLDEVGKYIEDILVVDDGSTDNSGMILAGRDDVCMIRHKHNCGYGRTLIQAFNFAKGCGYEWVISMDCDWQHEPSQIPHFLAAITENNADIISGSRYMEGSKQDSQAPTNRRLINERVTAMINETLEMDLTDSFCGFKAYRVAPIVKLDLDEAGYAFPLEFWVQVWQHELRVREIPISLIYNDPDRHFGGGLDEPSTRLKHYEEVFAAAMQRIEPHRRDSELRISTG